MKHLDINRFVLRMTRCGGGFHSKIRKPVLALCKATNAAAAAPIAKSLKVLRPIQKLENHLFYEEFS